MHTRNRSRVTKNGSLLVMLLTNAAIVTPSLATGTWTQPGYTITELGTLGGDASKGQSINDAGQVTGWSETADGARHAFVYENGEMRDLGTLLGGTNSVARAINSLGQVSGQSGINEHGPPFPEIFQAAMWDGSAMQSLGALYCACTYNRRYGSSILYAMNSVGQAVGDSETVRGEWVRHAFLWQDGSLIDIGGGAGDWSISSAFDINDQGQVVGDFAKDAGRLAVYNRRAFLWQDGNRIDLGTLPEHTSSSALAINSRGQIVGWSGTQDSLVLIVSRAFLSENRMMRDLGTLPTDTNSQALDINDRGQVVGWSGNADQTVSHAYLWVRGMMVDLNDLVKDNASWELNEAAAINNKGQITGAGLYNGQQRAYLLTFRPNVEFVVRRYLNNVRELNTNDVNDANARRKK